MPLFAAPIGTELKIVKVSADGETKRHLENLWILPGAMITVLKSEGGNVIVRVKDGRIALTKALALQILVG